MSIEGLELDLTAILLIPDPILLTEGLVPWQLPCVYRWVLLFFQSLERIFETVVSLVSSSLDVFQESSQSSRMLLEQRENPAKCEGLEAGGTFPFANRYSSISLVFRRNSSSSWWILSSSLSLLARAYQQSFVRFQLSLFSRTYSAWNLLSWLNPSYCLERQIQLVSVQLASYS